MKKRIIALACGMCLLVGIPSCLRFPTVAKAGTQPATQQVVVAPTSALGL